MLFFVLLFKLEDGGDLFLRNIARLHSVMSQEAELFITIAVRTSNTTWIEDVG
jgi:hypothetical protein